MKAKIHTLTLFETWSLLDEVKALLNHPISEKKSMEILSSLEKIQKNCDNDEVLEETLSLYGKVATAYNKHIAEEITALSMMKDDALRERKIKSLQRVNGISQENFQALSELGKNLVTKPLKIEQVPLEEIESLFDLASLVYYDKTTEAKEHFSHLSPTGARSLLKHFSAMKAPFLEKKSATLQAIFSAAYELAGKSLNRHLSGHEIDEFFEEKEKVVQEEKEEKNSSFVSLRMA